MGHKESDMTEQLTHTLFQKLGLGDEVNIWSLDLKCQKWSSETSPIPSYGNNVNTGESFYPLSYPINDETPSLPATLTETFDM